MNKRGLTASTIVFLAVLIVTLVTGVFTSFAGSITTDYKYTVNAILCVAVSLAAAGLTVGVQRVLQSRKTASVDPR